MDENQKPSWVERVSGYLAGGTGGLVVECLYFPLDTIKTRIQAQKQFEKYSAQKIGAEKTTKEMVKSQKYKNLLNGIQATVIGAFPIGFAYMWGYNEFTSHFKRIPMMKNVPESTGYFMGGIFAEICANIIRTPLEVIKQQMQVGMNRSLVMASIDIYKVSGFRGFYSGLPSLILRDAPYSAVFMPVYEGMKRLRLLPGEGDQSSTAGHLLNSAVAALVGVCLTQPMDVVKTAIMTHRGEKLRFLPVAKRILQEEGVQGFYRAFSLRLLNAIFFASVFFSIYERSLVFYQHRLAN